MPDKKFCVRVYGCLLIVGIFSLFGNVHARSQTTAYLSLPNMQQEVKLRFGALLKEHEMLINRVLLKEEMMFASSYYVFYHGQPAQMRIFQDVVKELYCYHNDIELSGLADFVPLRFHIKSPIFDGDINAYIDWAQSLFHTIDDNSCGALRSTLLSVNLSLYGNSRRLSSNSFHYFCASESHNYFDVRGAIETVFDHYQLDKKYVHECMALYDMVKTKTGNLLQICIPKNIVDRHVYLAAPGGVPYSMQLHNVIFDTKKKRHTHISPILELYVTSPYSIVNFIDGLQARVVLTGHQLGVSPDDGIKIFRYTTVSDAVMQQYREKLHALIKKMMDERQ